MLFWKQQMTSLFTSRDIFLRELIFCLIFDYNISKYLPSKILFNNIYKSLCSDEGNNVVTEKFSQFLSFCKFLFSLSLKCVLIILKMQL